jgi:hypothetical protein
MVKHLENMDLLWLDIKSLHHLLVWVDMVKESYLLLSPLLLSRSRLVQEEVEEVEQAALMGMASPVKEDLPLAV